MATFDPVLAHTGLDRIENIEQYLVSNPIGAAGVTSVFTRSGAVVAAASDYTLAQIAAGTNHTLALSGSSVMGSLAAGSAGQLLQSGGSAADPSWITPGWSAVVSISNTAALSTVINQTIPGGTIGNIAGLLVIIEGQYSNNTGAARGLTLKASFGGSVLWGDATGATAIGFSATSAPFYWEFLLSGRTDTSHQNMAGITFLGSEAAGSLGGVGTLAGGNILQATMAGTTAVDSTVNQDVLVQAQHTFASANLSLVGTAHIHVIT